MKLSNWRKEIVHTSRGQFEVFVKGEGEPICITHLYSEFNESGDYFADTFTDTNRVYLVNLRNAGHSEKAKNPYELSMIDAVLDLEEIRKSFGFKSWIFAGHSTGGMLGILYGIHFSSFIKKLILVGTSAREYTSSSNQCIYNEEHPKYERMQELMGLLTNRDLSEKERMLLTKERTQLSLFTPENYDTYFSKDITKKISGVRLNFFSREQLIYDVTRQLAKIKSETIILCGRYDVQCPINFSIEMNALIPNSKLYIFEKSNHYPFLEEEMRFKKIIHIELSK